MTTRAPKDKTDRSRSRLNEVRLIGRVSQNPEERELPSGDVLCTLRLIVERAPATTARTGRAAGASRQRVDTLECAVWTAPLRRRVRTWRAGDVVEVTGALRRRFYRAGAGAVSRVEVEVAAVALIRRANA